MSTVQVPQLGNQVDRDLLALYEAENANNNNKILYIRHGQIDFDTEENLFSVETFS